MQRSVNRLHDGSTCDFLKNRVSAYSAGSNSESWEVDIIDEKKLVFIGSMYKTIQWKLAFHWINRQSLLAKISDEVNELGEKL